MSKEGKKAVRTCSTLTEDLVRLLDWRTPAGCPPVASESTGVYWRPVFTSLAGALDVILTKAREAKGFTARKTAVIDAEGLGDLRRQGVLKPSCMPPVPLRELRELPRYRESLGREQTTLAHRSQKLSESANRKLGPVASAAWGGSGKLRLRAVAAGETDAEKLSP